MNQFTQVVSQSTVQEQSFIRRVYNWMTAGMGLTAVVSFYVLHNEQFLISLVQNPMLFYGLVIGELVLVVWLSSRIFHMSSTKATVLFFVYSAINGITLAPLFLIYTKASIVSAFIVCGGMFGVTSLYGYATKKDLSSWRGYLAMALIGGFLVFLVNSFFIKSSGLDFLFSLLFVGLGVGLTAYYTQKIKQMSHGMVGDEEMATKGAIIGAFSLYITFVMMFVHLLRLLGNRR